MMKLRNKKTGEIIEGYVVVAFKSKADSSIVLHDNTVGSVAKLSEKYEDYTPKEPLIKDEKIRKAVRAWAEANGYDKLLVKLWAYCGHGAISFYADDGDDEITFNTVEKFGLEHLKYYTITELCGEEEDEVQIET